MLASYHAACRHSFNNSLMRSQYCDCQTVIANLLPNIFYSANFIPKYIKIHSQK